MAELKGKKRKQPSSCPEGWAPGAVVVQLELTHRQQRYARRCVGIARFVYNRMVANDQAGRAVDLWLTPHELEKEFNATKRLNPSLAFVTEVSKFVAQGACRSYRNARSRWLNKELQARRPVFHKKNRTGTGSFLAASGVEPSSATMATGASGCPTWAAYRMTRNLPEGTPYEVSAQKTERPLVCRHRVLGTTHHTFPARNPIRGRSRCRYKPLGDGQRRGPSGPQGPLPAGPDGQRILGIPQLKGLRQGPHRR